MREARRGKYSAERLATADTPSLGASGAVMAITVASASLFPNDKIYYRGTLVPIPVVAGIYILSDTFLQIAGSRDGVDHAGHLGGTVAGAAYVMYVWNMAAAAKRGPLPIVSWLRSCVAAIPQKKK